jgi:1-acyl-sn-glycerol-3-phosphate acyltransferase
MLYSLVLFLLRAILRIIARVTVYGVDNMPSAGTVYIVVANHIGRLDPGFVYYLLNRKDIIMLVAEKYYEHTWSRLLAQAVNAIFVDRFNADLSAIREVLRRIKQGGILVIAPEGTRSPTTSLIQGWDGASYIAAKAGLPILPVSISGSGDKEVVVLPSPCLPSSIKTAMNSLPVIPRRSCAALQPSCLNHNTGFMLTTHA